MKTAKIISLGLIVGVVLLTSCQNNQEVAPQGDLLPKSFRVAIPAAISNQTVANGGRIAGRTKGDSLRGNDIYQNLNTFIAVGEMGSKIVEAFIDGIRKYHIDRVLSLTYVAADDNRTKNLVVVSQVTFEGKTWDYQLTIVDVESESQSDGGKALQLFWNTSSLIKGIAIIKPYNCDRVKNPNAADAIFRIDYTEGGDLGDPAKDCIDITQHRSVRKSQQDVAHLFDFTCPVLVILPIPRVVLAIQFHDQTPFSAQKIHCVDEQRNLPRRRCHESAIQR